MKEHAKVLELKNIYVRFNETTVLNNLSLSLRAGEIHAIVGEHRAGKSTITRLLGGAINKQSGIITLNKKNIDNFTPATSIKNRIGIIYQDVNLIPSLNAVENIFAGRFKVSWYRTILFGNMTTQVENFLNEWNLSIDLKTPVGRLPKADQNIVELIRAIYFDPDILIFDEISTKLNPDEIEIAYQLILYLKRKGKSIFYISNNMNEIFEFADRVSVLKNGSVISTQDIRSIDKVRLIDMTFSFASTREELRKKNVELYNYKKYNEDIINNLPLGVIILDRDKNIYLINYSALRILSIKSSIRMRDPDVIFNCFSPKLRNDLLRQINQGKTGNWEEIKFKKNQYIDITVFPFKDEDYAFLGTILLIQDISREYHFKNYLLQAERISSVAELAAGVAHEVNNPLGIILNYTELLSRYHSDSYSKEKIALIKSELNRIKSIIGSLLSFAHLKETPFVTFSIGELIDDTLLLLNHRFEPKNITVNRKTPECAVYIVGNENRFKQVFINLIINSVEAVSGNGIIDISVKAYRREGFAEICFANNGNEIPEAVLKNIFNPFFTTKSTKQNTGLGLRSFSGGRFIFS